MQVLFQPFTLKNLTLKNRLVLAPMSRYQNAGGIPNAAFADFHGSRARDIGLSITGATAIDMVSANNHPKLANINAAASAGWKQVVDAVHAAGGPLMLQLWHAGALQNVAPDFKPGPFLSPSGLMAPGQPVGQPMTESDIADVIAAFVQAAQLALQLGFDALEIHAAHGFLLDEFFWSATNLRSDRWGGASLPERSRFALEVTKAVRKAIGPDVVLALRVSQWKEQDYTVKLANTPDELAAWLCPFVDAGVDLLDCSQRRFWEPEFAGSHLNFAGWVKKLTAAPVITVGSVGLSNDVMTFFHGETAKHAPIDELVCRLENNEFDLVAVGRTLLADADWVRKLRANELATQPGLDPRAMMQWI
jgi:2,4-dienoyl-CoA reductase-like NADH-dependent reductase (Old Yellow Enzyme family)